MNVILKNAVKIGNRTFPKGEQIIPDSVASNRAFKELVRSGAAQVLPRSQVQQRVRLERDAKHFAKTKEKRREMNAAKALQSAPVAKGAVSPLPKAARPAQAVKTPTSPIAAGGEAKANPPAPAQEKE